MLPRISYFYIKLDIYNMKETVYIEEKEKDHHATTTSAKPGVIVITVSVVLVLLLNLINTIFFS